MTNQSNYSACRGSGPNILFLHGWKQNRHSWDTVVENLKGDFTCWTVDLPGFGDNPRPNASWTPAHYANWVAQFIKKNAIGHPVIVGHSFGGRIAVVLASNPRHYGINNASFIFYATPGFREALPFSKSITQALGRAIKKTWLPLNKAKLFLKLRDRLSSADYRESEELRDIFLATINYDLRSAMQHITNPVLLIWGEEDAEVPITIGQAMKHAITDAELKIIPDAGHFAHRENPSLFAGIIRSFTHHESHSNH